MINKLKYIIQLNSYEYKWGRKMLDLDFIYENVYLAELGGFISFFMGSKASTNLKNKILEADPKRGITIECDEQANVYSMSIKDNMINCGYEDKYGAVIEPDISVTEFLKALDIYIHECKKLETLKDKYTLDKPIEGEIEM